MSASFAGPDKSSIRNNTVNKEKSHLEHGEHDEHKHADTGKKDEYEDHDNIDEHKSDKHDNDHDDHDDHDDHADHDDHEGEEDGHRHGHGGGKAIGEGKAIVEVDEEKGLKLSKEAIKSLSIKLEDYTPSSKTKIAKKTLVTSKNQKGLYRFRRGFFKLINIRILKEESNHYLIRTSDLARGDQIVVGGVGLLRVSDIYSTDKSEYGHSH